MSYVIPADTHVPGDPGCTTDLDNAYDMLGLLTMAIAQLAGNGLSTPASNAANVTTVQGLTMQQVINALTGPQSAGKYLRSDGTNATLQSIQGSDIPALSQYLRTVAV